MNIVVHPRLEIRHFVIWKDRKELNIIPYSDLSKAQNGVLPHLGYHYSIFNRYERLDV